VIESWPKPNYIDPVTRGPALIYVCIVFSALSLAIVIARIYSRIFITRAPGADDLLVAIAAGGGIGLSVLLIIQEKTWYIGHHIWDIPVDKFSGQRKNIYICEWCYVVASSAVKISILLFYRRLSVTFSKTFLIATWVGIAYQVAYLIVFLSILLAIFRPLDSYWLSFDPTWAATHKYSHGNEQISLPISAALSVVGDFYSTVLPLLLVTFLDLPARQKTALYALFGLGFLVVAAGTVRTILLDRVIAKTYDVSWTLWETWTWTVIELNVAILAASAPALKPFFRRFVIDPIASTSRQAAYAHSSQRRSSGSKPKGRRRFGWSNNSTTARDSNIPVDIEKIGVAVGEPRSKADIIADEIDDETSTRRYQLRTSRDGKMVPVQVHEQASFDKRSAYTASSSDYILLPDKSSGFDASAEFRQHRLQIEGLPPVSRQQQYPLQDFKRSRNGPGSVPGPLARNPSQPSRSGSVKAARARLQRAQEFEQRGHAHSRSVSCGSDRNFSLPSSAVVAASPYQYFERDEHDSYDRSSSQETLGLPRQGSRQSHRPGVGYAV
jgi:hypothetical protein